MTIKTIIVAAGRGKRMEAGVPKQFLDLGGRPILMHTVEAFAAFSEVITVLPQAHIDRWKELCAEHDFNVPHKIVAGGDERFYSVKNALELVPDDAVVLIHDGVRPFASQRLISDAAEAARLHGSAVPILREVDSLRRKTDGGEFEIIDRHRIYAVQTPQAFSSTLLKQAYSAPYSPEFTDDASVFEKAGNGLFFIEGEKLNFKITTPQDLVLARAVLTMDR